MRCIKCGYDLRKLSEHRCPECGTEFNPSVTGKTIDGRVLLAWTGFAWTLVIILRLLSTPDDRDPAPCLVGAMVWLIIFYVVGRAGAALMGRQELVRYRRALIAGFVGAILLILMPLVGIIIAALRT